MDAMRNVSIFVSILALCAFADDAAAQSTSGTVERAYTLLDLEKCRHMESREAEDYRSWRCTGYGGIDVHVAAGDQRSYVSYGSNAANERAAEQTLASFNSAGRTIEWRTERLPNGKAHPFATILRWNTSVLDDKDNVIAGQVLIVTRLGPGGVCHVGYVDGRANPNANELAVQIADQHARTFQCGKDKTIVLGVKGPGFSGPYGDY
jgi:hypothetical protein